MTPPAGTKSAKGSKALGPLDYEFVSCPRCTVGSLRVVGWDEAALHEFLQGATVAPFTPSGGVVHLHCFLCDYHESRALDPWNKEAA